jgi:tetratricopeptide (TPR) repeat protein
MKDKNSTIEEARQKAEEELATRRVRVSLWTWLSIGFGAVVGFFIVGHHTFPANVLLLVIMVPILYVTFKASLRPYLFCVQHAIEILDKLPQVAFDYANRADVLGDYKFYEAAVEDYKTALAMNPDEDIDVDLTWYNLAYTLKELDRKDEALSIVEKLSTAEGHYQDLALKLRGKLLAEKDPVEGTK